jgi:hypothetical protein
MERLVYIYLNYYSLNKLEYEPGWEVEKPSFNDQIAGESVNKPTIMKLHVTGRNTRL